MELLLLLLDHTSIGHPNCQIFKSAGVQDTRHHLSGCERIVGNSLKHIKKRNCAGFITDVFLLKTLVTQKWPQLTPCAWHVTISHLWLLLFATTEITGLIWSERCTYSLTHVFYLSIYQSKFTANYPHLTQTVKAHFSQSITQQADLPQQPPNNMSFPPAQCGASFLFSFLMFLAKDTLTKV